MRVAVLAAQGQLGTDVVKVLENAGHEVMALGREVDILEPSQLAGAFANKPDAVVNCAAFTQVDNCEDQANHAFNVNAVGALNVARACAEVGAHLIHISTDYVFAGDKGQYSEGDAPNPRNVYGTSKLAGENLITQAGGRTAVVRVSSVYGAAGNGGRGGNFIETILKRGRETGKLQVVDDIFMSPTYTVDAAKALQVLLEQGFTGLTHLSSFARINWYTFAKTAIDLTGIDADVTPVPATTYPTKATRPADSSLTSKKLPEAARATLSPWQDALRSYLSEKGYL
jgi:dTDP-4-dehydrorhamnose reductase